MPLRFARAGSLLFVAAASALAPACEDDEAPGCFVTVDRPLAETPLTAMTEVSLQRVGDRFALVGVTDDTVRWAALTESGDLSNETTLAVPPHVAGPWPAVVGKTAPGDQLIAVVAAPKANGLVALEALVQDAGASGFATPKPLADLPGGTTKANLRGTATSFPSGMRAAFAWGTEGDTSKPRVLLLRADGESSPGPAVTGLPAGWSCLSLVPSGPQKLGLSVLRRTGGAQWGLAEIPEAAGALPLYQLPLDVDTAACPAAAPTRKGYTLAWANRDGVFLTPFDAARAAATTTLVAGAVRFGGAGHVPAVAGVAPTGKDFALALARSKGPEAWRVDVYARRQGAALPLRSSGAATAVATYPTDSALFATYRTGGMRHWTKIQCGEPADLADSGAGADAK